MFVVESRPTLHYSVCRSMAPPRVKNCAKVEKDVAYVVKPLQKLALQALRVTDALGLTPELKAQFDQGKTGDNHSFVMKDRACPSLGPLKVGEFGEFPGFRTEPLKAMFSVDMAKSASNLLQFLSLTERLPDPDEGVVKRYLWYLELQKSHYPNIFILPPPDVALVHFTHMLQSKEYHEFAQGFNLQWMSHCSMWMFEKDGNFKQFEEESRQLWNEANPYSKFGVFADKNRKYYPNETYSWTALEKLNPIRKEHGAPEANKCGIHASDPRVQSFGETWQIVPIPVDNVRNPGVIPSVSCVKDLNRLVAVVKLDRDWLVNLRAAFGGQINFSQPDLKHFQIGYQKYLYLLAKYPFRCEWIGFAPTPSIDLMWHAHLIQPKAYWRDVTFLCFGLPHHKLLPEVSRTPFVYEAHLSEETQLWQEEFAEDLHSYASIGPPNGSRSLQPEDESDWNSSSQDDNGVRTSPMPNSPILVRAAPVQDAVVPNPAPVRDDIRNALKSGKSSRRR